MKYVVSDVHGEYDLFRELLIKIKFTESDMLYICGDIIDKGESSIRLLKFIRTFPNIKCILGNHEYAFLKYYSSLLEESPDDFDSLLDKLQNYFPGEEERLVWEDIDWIESLPSYIEEDNFICVHAGIPIDNMQMLSPLETVSTEELVFDRKFKNLDVKHKSPKCVFFGHTQTDCVCGESKILGYLRNPSQKASTINDFFKIHLDTGSWSKGVLGCFCIDTLKAFYIRKGKI